MEPQEQVSQSRFQGLMEQVSRFHSFKVSTRAGFNKSRFQSFIVSRFHETGFKVAQNRFQGFRVSADQ